MNPDNRTIQQLSWVLRVGVAMEFIGHGALGINGQAAWVSYFAVVGISKAHALALMPLVGCFDVAMALTVLFYPMRAVILYMAAWGVWTALLRPLAGESPWEFFERAGNFGALYALFLLSTGGAGSWLSFRPVRDLDGRLTKRIHWVLLLTTVVLLAGHGALGLVVKKVVFAQQYSVLGLHDPWVEQLVGAFECLLALIVLVRPGFGLLLFILAWKLATEALAPMAGSPIWVFIEHGGSYAAPLALALLYRAREASPFPVRRAA
jgi:hypothetical protein